MHPPPCRRCPHLEHLLSEGAPLGESHSKRPFGPPAAQPKPSLDSEHTGARPIHHADVPRSPFRTKRPRHFSFPPLALRTTRKLGLRLRQIIWTRYKPASIPPVAQHP